MDVLKQVEQLIKSGHVANLDLLERKEVSLFLDLVKDSAADLLLPKCIRSHMNVGAKEALYPVRYF